CHCVTFQETTDIIVFGLSDYQNIQFSEYSIITKKKLSDVSDNRRMLYYYRKHSLFRLRNIGKKRQLS
ncbi:hypothetical protein, partial [Bacteroides xylanisolvens]|uniref:hypothetical protein n=2 Tax=Bacteroides TaxID=816 RepID=UPI001961F16B